MTLTATSGCGPRSGTPSPNGLITSSLTSKTLLFNSDSTAPQTFTVSESGYGGTFTAISSDINVVTIAQTSPAGTRAVFSVTCIDVGQATITISDSLGNSTSIPVRVFRPFAFAAAGVE